MVSELVLWQASGERLENPFETRILTWPSGYWGRHKSKAKSIFHISFFNGQYSFGSRLVSSFVAVSVFRGSFETRTNANHEMAQINTKYGVTPDSNEN